MPPFSIRERLSAEDAMFLYLDTKEMPLHIACVMVFDAPIPGREFRRLIASKLPLLPRYRQRVVFPPLNIGHPTWDEDPAFQLENHVFEAHLKHGTDAELQDVTARILSEAMDRRKPLWDMTLVSGLAGGRGAIIARVHHCMADGIAGVKLLHVLLDPNPKAGVPRVKRQRPAPAPAGANIPFVDGLLTSYSEIFDRLVSIQSYALNVAEAVLAQGVGAVYQLFRMGPDLFGPFEGLPFNQPCQGARKLVWTELPLAEVNAVREACGVKLNDVVLSLVTTAVRRYTQLHRAPVRGRTLRMMVPVNIRGRDGIGGENLGNRISMIPVNVPLDITDPVAQLRRMSETTAALKGGGVADFVGVAGNCLGLLPTPLQAMLGPYGSDLPFPPWNMVCTNVPGPQIPLYMLGRKLVAMYPYVPIGARMGLNCAVQSYDRNLYFGFTGSIAAAPDADVMPGLVEKAFAELCKRARVKRAEAAPVHRTQRSGRARSNGHLAGPAVAVAGAADVTAATPNGSGVVPAATQ